MWVASSTGDTGRSVGGASKAARFADRASRLGVGASIFESLSDGTGGWSATASVACVGSACIAADGAVGTIAGGLAGKVANGDALPLMPSAPRAAGGADGMSTIGGTTAVVALGRAGTTESRDGLVSFWPALAAIPRRYQQWRLLARSMR
jgi:hypothetical protein